MNETKFNLTKLRVASPCSVSWESMSGDERVRRCHSCKLDVHNFAGMTKTEVEDLILNRKGRICVRFYKRADGTVLTKDCPVGVRAYQKRAARFAGAALAAVLGLFSVSFGQKDKPKSVDASKIKTIRTISKQSGLTGKILDPNGALVPGVEITLQKDDTKELFKTVSDMEGNYKFEQVPVGKYTLETQTGSGFNKFRAINIEIKESEMLEFDLSLTVGENVTVGILLADSFIDTTSSGKTTVITREMIDRIPH